MQEEPSGNFIVVGIGASAGGIEALHAFFEQVPVKSNIAYVVILHLSPDHDSQLVRLLQQVARIPVQQVKEKVRIEPDHIYVIPPDRHLTMIDGSIVPAPNTHPEDRRAPVDIFFRTLAEAKKSRAVGVVLSGTGANGSMGLKRIKEQGGAVFVQNPREAAFNEMLRNAIATGFVDEVLNVAELPAHILNYKNTLGDAHIPEEATRRDEEVQQALREIFTQLRLRTGHDFTNYKRATLMRRIERRMAVRTLADLTQYAIFSNEHPEETQALLKDLLISVTNFFRDKPAFDALDLEALPALFEGRTSEDQVRIWVPGCATGEEAYTIAMLCAERTLGVVDAPKVQIFATDIGETAIAVAREGFYTLNDAADVSTERLARFFTREGDSYRIRRELRETILFAHHNFLKDPPFSRIDLISCRNVLIYLNRQAQERVMETFHFALRPGGFLMLGTSESVDTASDLFKPFNREQHIFQSRLSVNQRPIVVPESLQPLRLIPSIPLQSNIPVIAAPRTSYGELHFRLLEEYAPPSLIVNGEFDLLHTSQRAGRYLQMAGGEPTQAILKLIREELRSELRNGLYQATQKSTPVTSLPLHVRTEEGTEHIRIHIRPIQSNEDGKNGFLLVIFQPAVIDEEQEEAIVHTSDEVAARHLEDELARLRMLLRASNEQHEFQAEELKAGNEELQAMNEELRSATEELETSKEELQSINEELSTVNQELKVKVEEATMISNNLQNLINSTDIGTIFLDRSLRVVLFTPAVRSVYNLIPADYGRPLSDITSKLEENTVLEDAQLVLEQLQRIEREAQTVDGRALLVRLAPYRTEEDRIQGVVISLVDITERKHADEAIRASEEKYRTIFETIDEGFCIFELIYADGKPIDLKWVEVNPAYEKQTGLKDTVGKLASEVMPGTEASWLDVYDKVAKTGEAVHFENWHEPTGRWYNTSASRMDGPGSNCVAVLFADITERKQREEQQVYLLKLSDALRATPDPVAIEEAVTHIAMEQFGADRCYYATVKENGDILINREALRGDLPSIAGTYPLESFKIYKKIVDEGHAFVVNDAYTADIPDEDLRELLISLQLISLLNTPVVRNGKIVGILSIGQSAQRAWTTDEMELARETAERIWAAVERARAEEALRTNEDRMRGQKEAFQSVVNGASLAHSLNLLARMVTKETKDEARTAFYIANEEGTSLSPVYGAGDMPSDYLDQVNGFAIGDQAVTCGLAIPKGAAVITPDVFEEPLWRPWTWLAQAFDYRGCWCFPIQTREDKGVGTFAMYFRTRREASPQDMALADIVTRSAAVIMANYLESQERARIEDALLVSEERYRTALQSGNMAAWDWNIVDDSIRWNDQHFLLLGMPPEDRLVSSAFLLQFVHPDDRPAMNEALQKAITETGLFHMDAFRIIRADNEQVCWMSGFGRVVSRENGRGSRMVGVMYDVTDRIKVMHALRDRQLKLEIAQRAARIGIWGYDLVKNIGIATPEWNELTGYPHPGDSFELETFLEQVHPDDRNRLVAAHQQAVAEQGAEEIEFRLHHPERGLLWLLKRGQYIPPYDDVNASLMGSLIDITERKLLEQQKDQFIGIASHELRTPVTSIKAYVEILEELFRNNGDAESARLMYKLDEQVDRLTSLIYALLDTTRITEGKLQLELSTFDMTALITDTAETMQRIWGSIK